MTKAPKPDQRSAGWLAHALAPDRFPSPSDAMRAIADIVQALRSGGHNVASLGHGLRSIADVIDPPPKRGPKGPRNKTIDSELLRIYDAVSARHPAEIPEIPRRMAELLQESNPGKFGPSEEAIEKHIRRLLKKRDAMFAKIQKIRDGEEVFGKQPRRSGILGTPYVPPLRGKPGT